MIICLYVYVFCYILLLFACYCRNRRIRRIRRVFLFPPDLRFIRRVSLLVPPCSSPMSPLPFICFISDTTSSLRLAILPLAKIVFGK